MPLHAAAKPSAFFTPVLASIQQQPSLQIRRSAATQQITPADAQSILAAQRLKRPVSPHLEIYDKAQTWFGNSIFQRFTGGIYTGILYGYSIGYLVAPLAGWHLESASVAAAFAAWPLAAKVTVKMGLAWPFMFHFLNGIKHLYHDMTAKGFRKVQVKKLEMLVWGATTVSALGLVAFL